MCVAHSDVTVEDSSDTPLADVLLRSDHFTQGRPTVRITWNVRSLGFISKPGQIQELKTCIEGPLIDCLRQVPGFAGAMVLHAQREWRNLLVLTFWEAESQAADNYCWEEFSAVRKLLSPLIDVCTKVQTFQATLPPPTERCRQGKTATVC
jgi:hypothetical protein